MQKIDEEKSRRAGFRPDVPVTLADGQRWWLPKPRVRFSRRSLPDGGRDLVTRVEFAGDPGDYNEALERFERSMASGIATTLAMIDLGAALVAQNYDLSPAQLDAILEFAPDDPANQAAWRDLISTARGNAPKPEDSGDDPG